MNNSNQNEITYATGSSSSPYESIMCKKLIKNLQNNNLNGKIFIFKLIQNKGVMCSGGEVNPYEEFMGSNPTPTLGGSQKYGAFPFILEILSCQLKAGEFNKEK